jgi:iron-sulfur cluster repair protein YtfE (RIC family)
MKIDPEKTVAELYARHPAGLPVFAKYKIDLCCGGRHSLRTVAEKHGLDLEALLRELEEALEVKS